MAITLDGWLDWAEHVPGPPEKVYSEANAAIGYVPHSMVGSLQGWYSRLFCMDKLADGRFTPYAAASVHGSILRGGHVIQHYPLTASCWASGSRYPNTHFGAFENESVYRDGEPDESIPLTDPQIESNIRIIRELSEWRLWRPRRPLNPSDITASLYEHRECARFGSAPTACPSGRIPWARIITELEDDMSEADKKELAILRMWLDLGKAWANGDLQLLSNKLAFVGVRPTV